MQTNSKVRTFYPLQSIFGRWAANDNSRNNAPDLEGVSDFALRQAAKGLIPILLKSPQSALSIVTNCLKTIRNLQEEVQKLRKLAYYDELTGLNNRRGFLENLRQEFSRVTRGQSKGAEIIMIDLNHLKWANDTFGHAVGDQIIQTLAQSIKNNIRNTDFAARFGGDEYAICFTDLGENDSKIVLDRLRKIFNNLEINHKGHIIPVRALIGENHITTKKIGLHAGKSTHEIIEDFINTADQNMMARKAARDIDRASEPRGYIPASL